MAGAPGSPAGYDLDMGRAYQRLLSGGQGNELTVALTKLGIDAEADPTGSWVMNYSSMALHRRDGWLASARGFSRYLVGNESYANANHYGRYSNYGQLEILPADSDRRGFRQQGWDWNRWPGTTTIHLPFEQLAAKITQVDEYAGIEEMLLSDQRFSGANQLAGDSAMFAMKLHGHPKYNGSFRARKSLFFFDDRIIALGSGIENSDAAHDTETTLFQDFLDKKNELISLRGETLSGVDTQLDMTTEVGSYLLDTRSNGYYLPPGQQLVILRQTQTSFENKHKKPTTGDFATALLRHGKAPQNEGYEYAVLVAVGQGRARNFAASMADPNTAAYRVLQRDNRAHIVADRDSGTVGYALFEDSETINHGVIGSVNTPVMILARQENNHLDVALTDPDLNLYQGKDASQYDQASVQREVSIYSRNWRHAQPQKKTMRLSLKGHWAVGKQADNYRVIGLKGNSTVVEVDTVAATPVQMRFIKP
jgi:chondroitin-sulfate-ABC endolyase/exolyase